MGNNPDSQYYKRREFLRILFQKWSLNDVEQKMIDTLIQIGDNDINPILKSLQNGIKNAVSNQQFEKKIREIKLYLQKIPQQHRQIRASISSLEQKFNILNKAKPQSINIPTGQLAEKCVKLNQKISGLEQSLKGSLARLELFERRIQQEDQKLQNWIEYGKMIAIGGAAITIGYLAYKWWTKVDNDQRPRELIRQ